jgi:hypothetical protein
MVGNKRRVSIQQTSNEPEFRRIARRTLCTERLQIASLRSVTLFPFFLSVVILGTASLAAQDTAPSARPFSLAGQAHLDLPGDWSVRSDVRLPPPPLLITSAPHLVFSDVLLLENRTAPAILQFGVSDNPFLGSDAVQLDTRVHQDFVRDFFYFFFPPPRACLASAKNSFEEARRKEEERLEREEEAQEKNQKKSVPARRTVALSETCEFSPIPSDFYAAQVSTSVTLHETPQGDRVEGRWRNFYLPPMEQLELKGKTFFIFEARAEQPLERADIERFGLPDDRPGARAYFFWAIGANTPFPFFRDPHRKDLQLLHVVFACLGFDGDARTEFRKLLDDIAFER